MISRPTARTGGVAAFAYVVLATLAASAAAAPTTYSESVSGDLGDFGSLTTFNFDVGVNTVSGTYGSVGVNDFDSFAFTMPAGTQLDAGSVTQADLTGDITTSTWNLRSGPTSTTYNTGTLHEILGGTVPGTDNLITTPLPANTYGVSHAGFSGPAGSSATYTFSFTVTPEPAGIALIATVSIAALTCRRRQRS